MTKLFTIHDRSLKCDTVTFIQETIQAAGSYYYNYCTVVERRDLDLYEIGEISISEPAEGSVSGIYQFVSIDRKYLCSMPEHLEEE